MTMTMTQLTVVTEPVSGRLLFLRIRDRKKDSQLEYKEELVDGNQVLQSSV